MFIDIAMVTVPVLGLVCFIVWATAREIINKMEDYCFYDKVHYAQIAEITLYILIIAVGVWYGSGGRYRWVSMPVIIFALSVTGTTFMTILCVGWENIILAFFRAKHQFLDAQQIALYIAALTIAALFTVVSLAAVFQFDAFFEFCVRPDTLIEYHAAFSEFRDEHPDWNWEEYEPYGD